MNDLAEHVSINGIDLATLVKTNHGDITAMTAIHTRQHPWRQGGVRFARSANEIELAHLAVGMSEKALAADIPIDGMKCLIVCPGGVPATAQERAKILADHIKVVRGIEPNAVFGPDMNCQEDVLDIVYSKHDLKSSVTGLSKHNGGLEIDKNGFTAIGVMAAIETATNFLDNNLSTASIQGFGAVGAHLAKLLNDSNYSVAAISDINGCLYSDSRIDIDAVIRLGAELSTETVSELETISSVKGVFFAPPEKLFGRRADIFVLAARTSVLALKSELPTIHRENSDARSVEQMQEEVQPTIVVEAANHPLSYAAEQFLSEHGIVILPDILVNCGGMIGCWYEYKHRSELLKDSMIYNKGTKLCLDFSEQKIERNISRLLAEKVEHKKFERLVSEEIVANRLQLAGDRQAKHSLER